MASETEELNFYFKMLFVCINLDLYLNSHMCLVAMVLDSKVI